MGHVLTKRVNIRLQKFLALGGVGSRRASERLITEGRVTVDGKTVACQGVKINPDCQIVKVDGRRIVPEPKITLLFHKPRNVICTASDPQERKTFLSYLPKFPARVFTVGRLDRASEGLLIITSDGDLAQSISHPRNMVAKTYLVTVGCALAPAQLNQLRHGIYSEAPRGKPRGIFAEPCEAKSAIPPCGKPQGFLAKKGEGELLRLVDIQPEGYAQNRHVYRVIISEGKNRHIRRMFAGLNLDVQALKRIAIGPLKLGKLRVGQWRYLTGGEQDELRRYIVACAGRRPA